MTFYAHNLIIGGPVLIRRWSCLGIVVESDHHLSSTLLIIISCMSTLVSRPNRNGVDAGWIAICCTRIVVCASIASCPYIYWAFTITSLHKCSTYVARTKKQEICLITLQVATALLVAGYTLTFWILWQTSFASTSSYSSVVQSAMLLV